MQEEIHQLLAAEFEDAAITVEVDGNRALIEITSERFADLSRLKRQQAVYACINDMIADGRLHAVTLKADVP